MKPSIRQVVVYSQSTYLVNGCRDVLKELEHRDTTICRDENDCIEALQERPEALLVLDWGLGSMSALKILTALQNPIKILIRPIFLVSSNPTDDLAGVAIEYGVLRVMTGSISRNLIKENIQAIMNEVASQKDVSQQLASVAKARMNGEWAVARSLLEGLSRIYPDDAKVTAALAENLVFEGKTYEALALLERHYEEGSEDVRLLNLYGRCLLKLSRHDEAALVLQRAKVINPYNVERLLELGDVLLEIGEFSEAKQNYVEALEFDKKNKRAQKSLGKALLVTGEINEALRFLKDVTGSTECASIFNAAGVLCVRHNRIDDGLRLYEFAVKTLRIHQSLLAKLAFNLGLGYYRKNALKAALYYFTLACSLDSSYEKARRNLNILNKKVTTDFQIRLDGHIVDTFFPGDIHAEIESEEGIEDTLVDVPLYGDNLC